MSSLISVTTALRLLQALTFVWAGLVLGISFLEAPVKFTAPSVTRAIGLDVGRHVFAALNKVEIGFGLIALVLLFMAGPEPRVRSVLIGVIVIVALQTGWLLPVLKEQAATIIQGGDGPTSSYAHVAYVFLDVAKVVGLLYVGWCVSS